MRLLAPAKLNLFLLVGRRRPDGFHSLVSWMCTLGFFDTLELSSTDAPGVKLTVRGAELPPGRDNLVVKAAEALAAELEAQGEGLFRRQGVSAVLDKRIPAGAGLGGGSSDAAATLLGLARLWKLSWARNRLADFSAKLGSDVPFFLHGPSAIVSGRGETVRTVAEPTVRWAVLILPELSAPTAEVYRQFDEMNLGRESSDLSEPHRWDWVGQSSEDLLGRLVNDLEPAAFALFPRLRDLRADAEQILGRPVRMSGSGSSHFSLFDQELQAVAAAELLRRQLSARTLAVELAPEVKDDLRPSRPAQE